MTLNILSVAHDRCLNEPGGLSLVGFDNISIATRSWPPLTTVVQPIRQMAKHATSLLLDIVAGTITTADKVIEEIPSSLVHRKSTARPSSQRK